MKLPLDIIKDKIFSLSAAADKVSEWKHNGEKVVFTNGCFDIVHLGHVTYLADAKAEGDRLVVALNSSDSITRLKGPNRPITSQDSRMMVMASLEVVDMVVVFEEDTPLNLIEKLTPSMLVKGGDWLPEQIIGSKHVIKNGGEVKSLPFREGYSTTSIESKIKDSI